MLKKLFTYINVQKLSYFITSFAMDTVLIMSMALEVMKFICRPTVLEICVF